ncbi:MAG TPA: hypothetical protein VNH18_36475 [Bryobacteraceae bacterium]|nr:hypothetical protein [Bryobacteraceae bacterium]
MPLNVLKDIRKIYAGLNPDEIRGAAWQDVKVGLVASTDEMYDRMEAFLAPAAAEPHIQAQALRAVHQAGDDPKRYDFVLCEPGVPVPRNGYLFESDDSNSLARLILEENPKLELALARTFPLFRASASGRIIYRVARENALFALVTALPNVVPSVLELPWTLGEFATDTAFLTMNQVRMALQLAAAYGRPVGYSEQKIELGTIVAGAFGWRALARELVGKIPLGGGLIPKAAVAFAGTYVVGLGLEKLNRTGDGMTRQQRRDAYSAAFEHGKKVARELAPEGVG